MLHAHTLKLSVNNNIMRRKRSGISTIIGATFFLITIILAMSVMSWTLQQQANFSTATSQVSALQLDRQRSALQITEAKISIGKFNITLQNNGPLPEHLVRLWVTDETSTNWHNNYAIDYLVNPKQVSTNIGQNLPLAFASTDAYTLKIVTERGNLITFRSLSVAQSNLAISLYVVPSTISSGANVTIIMSVSNNQRDVDSVHNLIPQLTNSYTCVNLLCPTITQKVAPTGIDTLLRGSTALFKWIYNIQGPATSTITFTGTLQNAPSSNSAQDSVRIQTIQADVSTLATEYGTITIDYNSLRWSTTGGLTSSSWQSGWSIPGGVGTIWKINMTNQSTRPIYVSQNSVYVITKVSSAANNPWYIVAGPSTASVALAYTDYSLVLLPKVVTPVYFAATQEGGSTITSTPSTTNNKNQYAGYMLMFGTYDAPASSSTYGQNIPFLGIITI